MNGENFRETGKKIDRAGTKPPPVLCVVVPCCNEEEALPETVATLSEVLRRLAEKGKTAPESYLCFVDDGSTDATWQVIEDESRQRAHMKGLKLSANFGHQNALIAGLFSERRNAGCLLTIDADLQDDPDVIEDMIDAFRAGSKVVYGVRNNRDVDGWYKRLLAHGYYSLMRKMNRRTIYNHADFRLAAAEVIFHLEQFGEVNLYLRNIFPLIGFPSARVYYKRKERAAGTSKYPVGKLMSLAWQGITSFTTTPLRIIFRLGVVTLLLSFVLLLWVLWATLAGKGLQGWASTLMPLLFFSGLNMLALGVIGEYIGKIYQEVKNRPRFIIEKETDREDESE